VILTEPMVQWKVQEYEKMDRMNIQKAGYFMYSYGVYNLLREEWI
jgi:hypothetical protein